MKSKSLAPIPATLALSAFLVSPGFGAENAPAPAASPASAEAGVDTNSETYRKAYDKAYAEAKARLAGNAPATATPGDTKPDAPTPVVTTDKDGKIADAIVTAKKETTTKPYVAESADFKRPTPLLDTPQQITVVSQQVLQDRNAVDLKDALKNSPGITFNAGEGGNSGGDNFNMRGFNAQSDIFIDGVRDTALYNRDAFSIEQVEIAKGSSGVYAGRGSTGGSINLVTKTAHAGNDGSVALTGSSANSLRAVADANVDVSQQIDAVKDAGVAFRMVAMAQDGGTPRATENSDRRFGLLPSLAIGLGSQTTVKLSHEYYEQNSGGDYGIPYGPKLGQPVLPNSDRSNYEAAPVDFTNWYGVKGVSRDDTTANITTAEIVSKIDDYNTLRNVTRYNSNLRDTIIYRPNGAPIAALTGTNSNTRSGVDAAAGTVTASPTNRYVETDILSNQTDLVSRFKTGDIGHTLNIGAEIQQEKTSNRSRLAVGPNPVFNLYNPNSNLVGNQSFVFSGAKTVANAETYGVYVNETVHLIKQVDLIGGLRYDHFDASVKGYGANLTNTNGGAPTSGTPAAPTSFDSSNDMLGWRGGVVFKPTETVSLYGTAANSYNPSAGDLTLTSATQDLAPEQTYLYEVGAKWEPIKDRLSFSLAYFYADKFNLRQTDPVTSLQNIEGQAVSQGVEFSAAGALTKKWNIFGGFSFIDTQVKKSQTGAVNPALSTVGKELVNTPDYSATIWTTYDIGDGWAVGGGVRYVGTRWADTLNTAKLGDYVVGDLAIYKQVNKWLRVQVNVDNIADTRYIETARAQGDGWATPGAGRTISGTIRATF